MLVDLFRDFGFYYYGVDRPGRDHVYVKDMPRRPPDVDMDCLAYAIKYYPYSKLRNCSAYLVPITPRFHEILFPELRIQTDLFEGPRISAGNAIKQAYLCKSNTKSIKAGDLLFFYRTDDSKAITTYGVVDQFHIESDPEKILQWVSKRTVFSGEDISSMASAAKHGVRVILFRLMGHLESPLSYSRLQKLRIVSGPIQSVTNISAEKSALIINEAGINDRVLSN